MEKQSEALRLANHLELFEINDIRCVQAAAELRRLHELSESEGRWASEYLARALKAEALNAQLLEAEQAIHQERLRFTTEQWEIECKSQVEIEREAILDLVDGYAKNNTDLRDAIRARSQA